MLSAVDKLHKLYSSTLGTLVRLRSAGLEIVNESDFVKSILMLQAGGSNGYQPQKGSQWLASAAVVQSVLKTSDGAQSMARAFRKFIGSATESAIRQFNERK
jgi:ubiquinone biosynthesis monooxygenase Coq6